MSVTLTSPVTGAAQTGFTSPTYTHVTDVAPDVNGKQNAVTAAGGTQVGVTVHSVAAPFTFTFTRPKQFKSLGKANPVTGVVASVPRNVYTGILRKGVIPLAGQPYAVMLARFSIEVPAGADVADAPNVRAALSMFIGALTQVSSGIGDTCVTGII